jgi:hypothetical protein
MFNFDLVRGLSRKAIEEDDAEKVDKLLSQLQSILSKELDGRTSQSQSEPQMRRRKSGCEEK